MKETIIILGAGVMQGPAIKIAKELRFHTVVLDGSKDAPCICQADQFVQIDLKDKESIETYARSLKGKIGIMTAGTDFSASVAWVAEKLGLPGIPYKTALKASDKGLMRACFSEAGLPSPPFAVISESSFDIPDYLQFPLVIKPVDNMGSRGCRRVNAKEEFIEAAKSAIGFSRSGKAIAESYMDGPEFSVDAIVYKGEITICGLADRHIFFPPYFIEMGHTMPTENKEENAILETFCRGVHALGLANKENIGAAKGDIKLTSNGPMIGEIAARLSGGYMSGWTYPYSSGVLPTKAAILAAMGRKPEGLVPTRKWTCAERAFISIPGKVKQIIQGNTQVNDIFIRIKEGDNVSFPENNVTKCGNVIASAKNREDAINAAETAAKSFLIRLDPCDTQTRDFLAKTSNFPPNAFQLTDELKRALSELEDFTTNQHEHTRRELRNSINVRDSSYGSWLKSKDDSGSWLKTCYIIPFAAFTSSGLKDYMGRTAEEALEAVRNLTGFKLPFACENAENIIRLGRSFWAALIRGSYQGAVYYIDNLGSNEN
ncbi:MAG: ATP-grasp domain-containing protein [Treponema sp.]|nr:ATP-grasp domain-containing protein [Treponema sp.]